jgi:hypothetical protein
VISSYVPAFVGLDTQLRLSLQLPRLAPWLLAWVKPGLGYLGWAVGAGVLAALLAWKPCPALAEVLVLKQGEVRTLPLLQTRARPSLQMEMLYLGMVEERFLGYAHANNWETISSDREDPRWSRWQLRPGGEALYPPDAPPSRDPSEPPLYARGFYVEAYFMGGRLARPACPKGLLGHHPSPLPCRHSAQQPPALLPGFFQPYLASAARSPLCASSLPGSS